MNINERLARARLDHLDYVTHLARINNEVRRPAVARARTRVQMAVCDTTHDTPRSDAAPRANRAEIA